MARNFTNVVDYVRTQLDTFEQRGVCRVDSLVFSCIAYLRPPEEAAEVYGTQGMPLKELYRAEWFEALCSKCYDPLSSQELLTALAASPRFRDVRVSGYTSQVDKVAEQQFSAMVFSLSPTQTFVAFRGTDNTLVGWKEDFNMSFSTTVPSQVSAAAYLRDVAARTTGELWTGGHSKGGNLAVYAGMMCDEDVRRRLVSCYTHDGPGFSTDTMADARWREAHEQVYVDKTVPQSSTIGMIFENQENECCVVHSESMGFSQHDPYSWEVVGCDFVVEDGLGISATLLDSSVNEWLNKTSQENRERFVDTIFSVLDAAGLGTMAEMKANWRIAAPRMIKAAAGLESEDRQLVLAAVGEVARAMVPGGEIPEE